MDEQQSVSLCTHLVYVVAQEDEIWYEQLNHHLYPLQQCEHLSSWSVLQVPAGTIWQQEMEAQLAKASLLVLLLSPDFFVSDRCSYMIELALASHKQLLPVLLRPVAWQLTSLAHLCPLPYNSIPIVLWDNYDAALLEIAHAIHARINPEGASRLASLRGSLLGTRCDCYEQISLPRNYIQRVDVIDAIRRLLLADSSPASLTSTQSRKMYALHGMGGIGKSVIARALCDDPSIQAIFPDGILWATLGQAPDLVTIMRLWINKLGGTISETAPTLESLKVNLASLLKERACLLILDDVWRWTHAETFSIGGARCNFILTTRDTEIAYELGATVFPIPLMTEAEATILLEEWAGGRLSETEPALKSQIVSRLGYLPLAVKLAGAQLRRVQPEQWIHTFHIGKLKSARPEDLHSDLKLTFQLSVDELEREACYLYTTLSIFRETEPIPLMSIRKLWQEIGGLDANETRQLLDDLAARALVELSNNLFATTIQLHDLLRDAIKEEVRDEQKALHQSLLRVYDRHRSGREWHTVQDDGYIYDHLAYHLYHAGKVQDLKYLFANHNWLHVRVPQSNYLYDGYLEDLLFAWKCVDEEIEGQIEHGLAPTSFGASIRYTLIRASINDVAQNYIPELVVQAIKTGLWTQERALSIARRIPTEEKRARMYTALLTSKTLSHDQELHILEQALEDILSLNENQERAERFSEIFPLLPLDQRNELLRREIEAVLAMTDRSRRASILAALVPLLPADRQYHILQQELKSVAKSKQDRDWILLVLAPLLEGDLVELGFQYALTLKGEESLAILLKKLLPKLDGDLLEQALRTVLSLASEQHQADLLAACSSKLCEEMLEKAKEASLAFTHNGYRAYALAMLAPQFTPPQSTHLLELSLSAASVKFHEDAEEYYALALLQLIPQVSCTQLARIAQVALNLVEDDLRSQVLAKLAMRFSGEKRVQMLELSLDAALVADDPWPVVNLAQQLQGEQLEKALRAAVILGDEEERVKAIALLIAQLPEQSREKLLRHEMKMVLSIKDETEFSEALSVLAPYLEKDLLNLALQAALALSNDIDRAKALANLFPQLPVEVYTTLLKRELEQDIQNDHRHSSALLIHYYAKYLTPDLLDRAIKSLSMIDFEPERVWALTSLAHLMTQEECAQALHMARAGNIEIFLAWDLTNLLPHLRGDLLDEALRTIVALESEREQVAALVELPSHLSSYQKSMLIEAAFSMKQEQYKAEAISSLIEYMDENYIKQILETEIVCMSEDGKAKLLMALAGKLHGALLEQGIQRAGDLKNVIVRSVVMASFVPNMEKTVFLTKNIYQMLQSYLQMIRFSSRQEALAFYTHKMLFSSALFSHEILEAIAWHIVEICEQWHWI